MCTGHLLYLISSHLNKEELSQSKKLRDWHF